MIANYGEDQKRTSLSVISDNKRIEIETKPSEDEETIKVGDDSMFCIFTVDKNRLKDCLVPGKMSLIKLHF